MFSSSAMSIPREHSTSPLLPRMGKGKDRPAKKGLFRF
jgi:hypothetical protein